MIIGNGVGEEECFSMVFKMDLLRIINMHWIFIIYQRKFINITNVSKSLITCFDHTDLMNNNAIKDLFMIP
eukprot:UN03466